MLVASMNPSLEGTLTTLKNQ